MAELDALWRWPKPARVRAHVNQMQANTVERLSGSQIWAGVYTPASDGCGHPAGNGGDGGVVTGEKDRRGHLQGGQIEGAHRERLERWSRVRVHHPRPRGPMTESVVRSREELERLGVYDPDGSDADDVLRILRRVFELGATVDEVVEAAKIRGLGPLAMELMIRPPGELVEFADAAAQAGIDEAMATRLWRAFGFTDPIPGSTRLTSDEVGLMDLVGGAIILLGEEPAFAIARVAGSSAARVGEAISNAFRVEWELPLLDEGVPYSTVVERYAVLARDLLPPFLDGVAALIRRHALAVAYRMWAPDAARRAVTIQAAVGFVDIVASTPMTQSLPPGELAGMLTAFENQVAEAVGRAGGRLVKLIGDEAMFVVPDPAAACAMALDLAVHHDLPPMRVGLACGTITAAYGDYFGATVNLASRLVSVAEPTTVVVDRAVREAAEERFVFEALPPLALKGFAEPVTGYQVHRRSAGR